jgi:predicted HAD superfamily Cof-like phosphohydrolase
MTQATEQADFMIRCHQSVGSFNYRQAYLYESLVDEEYRELKAAMAELRMALKYPGARNIADLTAEVVDALVDIQYVCLGLGHSLGVDMDKSWDEVQRSNMSKVCDKTGKVQKHPETGKVQKPVTFSPPDMLKVVRESWRDAPYSE